jgi:isochorismate hydrolase
MILVEDAVAEVSRDTHEAELKTMARVFADVKTTDEVLAMLAEVATAASSTILADHEVFTDRGK